MSKYLTQQGIPLNFCQGFKYIPKSYGRVADIKIPTTHLKESTNEVQESTQEYSMPVFIQMKNLGYIYISNMRVCCEKYIQVIRFIKALSLPTHITHVT